MAKAICKFCEREFESTGNYKYCCADHRNEYAKWKSYLEKQNKPKMFVKKCKVCGIEFETQAAAQRYCSKCRETILNANKPKVSDIVRLCVVCGKEISLERKKKGAITCSDECGSIRNKETNKIYQKNINIKKPKCERKIPTFPKLDQELEKRAAKLGMSYGEIQGYRYQGLLQKEVERRENEIKGEHIYKSYIGGGGRGQRQVKRWRYH